jgi:cytochrome c oxidase subunit 2
MSIASLGGYTKGHGLNDKSCVSLKYDCVCNFIKRTSNPRKVVTMKSRFLGKTIFIGCLAMCSLALSGFSPAPDAPQRIDVSVKKFAYNPAEITLKKGEPVVLVLKTEDVAHGLKFKELNLNTKIEKGKSSELAFTPDKVGDFVGHCSVFCGSGHGSMTLTLHVTE